MKIIKRLIGEIKSYFNNNRNFNDNFDDPFMLNNNFKFKIYYENQQHQKFESILEKGGAMDLELCYGDKALSEVFGFRNIDINDSVVKKARYNFRFTNIKVVDKYQKKGVCSCLLLRSIIIVLENLKDEDVEFSLVNTVQPEQDVRIKDKFKVYKCALEEIKENENIQYHFFNSSKRNQDLVVLKERYRQKCEKIIKESKLFTIR